ncbi:MAG: disulfide bond formation protein DsbA [Actinobacteria bacterium]|nr:MAG: disulfide bond formation protein DsbA [Actinomycetota bacterium]
MTSGTAFERDDTGISLPQLRPARSRSHRFSPCARPSTTTSARPTRTSPPSGSAGSSWSETPARAEGIAEIERRAAEYGLPPLAWPKPWPGNTLVAMRAATFAKQTGRAVSFSLAGFRQAFAAGRDLTDVDNVMIAGAACELHPRALLKAVETEGVKGALREATDRAGDLGVEGVPAVVVDGEVFWGDDRLEDAVEAAARS